MVNCCSFSYLFDDFEMIELCFTNDCFGQKLNGLDVAGTNHIAAGMMELLVAAGMKGSLQVHSQLLCYRITISLL